MNSSEVKEEFRDKTGKLKMFMLGCSKKGHFNVPLCVWGMWRLGCVGQHFTKDRLNIEHKESILNMRVSDIETGRRR